MANIPNQWADPGRAAFEELDTYTQTFLLAGNHPELAQPYSYAVETGQSVAQFLVVGFDSNGYLVPATWDAVPANAIQAVGVVAQAGGSATEDQNVPVFYQGAFNMDALVWDASFDTDAKKEAAFRGAPTPTQIVIAKR